MRTGMRTGLMGTMVALALAAGCDGTGTSSDTTTIVPEVAPTTAISDTAGTELAYDEMAKAACPGAPRGDFAGTALVSNGNWGTWGCAQWCPAGSYAYGFSHKSEPSQGAGDDSALNGIMLNCNNRATGAWTANVTSLVQQWGPWLSVAMCPNTNSPLYTGNLQLESSQGGGDDTSANRLSGTCWDGTQINPPSNTAWGSWRGWVNCPAGQAVCGIRTRVEAAQSFDDDTALNGVELQCCTF
jgi:hypothetical protein